MLVKEAPPRQSAVKRGRVHPPATTRPPVEWWQSDGQNYGSTPVLVSADSVPTGSFEYHWRDRESFSVGDGFKAGLRAAVPGALLGGVAGCGIATGINVAAFLMALEGVQNPFGLSGFLSLGIAGLIGAGTGGAVTAYQAVTTARESFVQGNLVPGLIMNEQFANGEESPKFFIDGKLLEEVDLEAYADLPQRPVHEAANPWWKSAASS